MTQASLCSRITTSILALSLIFLANARALNAQDISGGAGVLLVSADVEARLGKGIFTSPQNVAHAPKRLEKKTVARVRSAHTRQTTGGGGQEANNGGGSGSGPLGPAAARREDARRSRRVTPPETRCLCSAPQSAPLRQSSATVHQG